MGSTILENLETKRWKWEIAQTMGGCQVVYFMPLDQLQWNLLISFYPVVETS